jgi:hypothetical protein
MAEGSTRLILIGAAVLLGPPTASNTLLSAVAMGLL